MRCDLLPMLLDASRGCGFEGHTATFCHFPKHGKQQLKKKKSTKTLTIFFLKSSRNIAAICRIASKMLLCLAAFLLAVLAKQLPSSTYRERPEEQGLDPRL